MLEQTELINCDISPKGSSICSLFLFRMCQVSSNRTDQMSLFSRIATFGAVRGAETVTFSSEDDVIVFLPAAGTGTVAVKDTFSIATVRASRKTEDDVIVFLPAGGTRAVTVFSRIATFGAVRGAETATSSEDDVIVFLLASGTKPVAVFLLMAEAGGVRAAYAATF